MIVGVTYSDHNMTRSAEICRESMLSNWFDEVHRIDENLWNSSPFDSFAILNLSTLIEKRGAGYWLWKPYAIAMHMAGLSNGDILIYSDAGVKWIADPRHIIDAMDQDLFLFSNGHQHVHWCKGDVIYGICSSHVPDAQQQAQASVIFIRVSDFSRKFIKEWLLWCQMPGFIDDSPSVLPNHPEFAEHRHDQAILTCLAIKYGIKLHWWPDHLWYESQRHRWPDDAYPLMFEHHRKRNNEY